MVMRLGTCNCQNYHCYGELEKDTIAWIFAQRGDLIMYLDSYILAYN